MATNLDFPTELVEPVKHFQTSIESVDKIIRPLLSVTQSDHHKEQLTSLEKARVDCLNASVLNTLVWMWLRSKGENPRETELKLELERTKAVMMKAKVLQDRDKRHKVDTAAAKRFVKGGLFDHKARKPK